ncbi:MAG TPA: SIMPL domain-containing protein [Acetobacteraceae bacterium]
MLRPLLLALLLLAALPAHAETLLRLSETAHVSVRPDELAATLAAEAEHAIAAEAQSRINAAIARALDAAKATPGVVPATGYYRVWRTGPPNDRWHASQTLDLHGADGEVLLKLVGTLQAQGLAVRQLAWRLAPETARRAQSEATRMALGRLQARAEEAAAIVGLRFASFREIRLDGSHSLPGPLPRMAMAAAAPMAAPVAEAEDVAVEASVEADVVLVPK